MGRQGERHRPPGIPWKTWNYDAASSQNGCRYVNMWHVGCVLCVSYCHKSYVAYVPQVVCELCHMLCVNMWYVGCVVCCVWVSVTIVFLVRFWVSLKWLHIIRNPEPQTLDPKLETLNLKPALGKTCFSRRKAR